MSSYLYKEGDIFRFSSFQMLIDRYLSSLQFAYYRLRAASDTSKSMQDYDNYPTSCVIVKLKDDIKTLFQKLQA